VTDAFSAGRRTGFLHSFRPKSDVNPSVLSSRRGKASAKELPPGQGSGFRSVPMIDFIMGRFLANCFPFGRSAEGSFEKPQLPHFREVTPVLLQIHQPQDREPTDLYCSKECRQTAASGGAGHSASTRNRRPPASRISEASPSSFQPLSVHVVGANLCHESRASRSIMPRTESVVCFRVDVSPLASSQLRFRKAVIRRGKLGPVDDFVAGPAAKLAAREPSRSRKAP